MTGRRGGFIVVGLVAPTLQLPGGHAVQAARLLKMWQGDADVRLRLIPINPALPRALGPWRRTRYIRTAATQCRYWPLLLREIPHVDVVHVFSPSNSSFFRSAAPAILTARTCGKPVVVNYRGDAGSHLARSAAARRLLRAAESIVVPSAYFERIFAAVGFRSRVVPNVADLEQFRYRPRTTIRPRLLSTRNFEPIYNVPCTLRAFARVQRRHPDASLVLVGGGTEERALRRLAEELRIRNVTFAGRVPHHAIHRFYDAADIYVQTPLVDNMPGSLIEAFASGLPVVATRVGGVPVILQDGVHGLLADSDDDDAVARQIVRTIEDPPASLRMAAEAAAACCAYDPAEVREQWRAVYRALARPASSARPS